MVQVIHRFHIRMLFFFLDLTIAVVTMCSPLLLQAKMRLWHGQWHQPVFTPETTSLVHHRYATLSVVFAPETISRGQATMVDMWPMRGPLHGLHWH